MNMYEIQRYRTAEGKVPFTEWLRNLRNFVARAAIDRRILRMENGNFGDHKFCVDGVWELRIPAGPGYRVYYALDGNQVVLLLCDGDKSTQSSDISRAVQCWRDWQRRKTE